jgi:hypothetical protein
MVKIKVRAYTLKEAEDIKKFCLKQGYEGVQNDSYRYCKSSASYALEKGTCFICVNNGYFGNIIVCDTHWHKHHQYKELSKSKFKEILIKYKYK